MRRPPRSFLSGSRCLVASAVLAGTALPSIAHAGPSDNSSSRPTTVQLGLGPVVTIPGGGVYGRIPIDFQVHFRRGDVGPALGLQLPINFARGLFGMHIGPIFIWDFRITRIGRAKLYLGPLATTGYGFATAVGGHGAAHFWFLTLGAQFRALWNDRAGLFIRPASFDVLVGNGYAAGAWSFTAGLALAF
jgi:hypothetical protein